MMFHTFRQSFLLIVGGLGIATGCSSKGSDTSFDGENAPYGNRGPTTVTQSVIQKGGITSDAVTQVAGEKSIGGNTYTRLTCTSTSNPASGVEWWISEQPGESITLAGWDGHSDLAVGIVPPGTVTLDHPLTVSLKPPLNTPQTVSSSATIQVPGDATVHKGQATFDYTLVDDNAAVETSMGTVFGCSHFTGKASATSDLLPAFLAGTAVSGDIWYHPSYGVVAFTSPELGLGMEISGANDCSLPDSSGHAIVRKVGIVDPTHPFKVSTYDDCNQDFDADKDQHAQMLLELRWADDAKAKASAPDTLGPMMRIKFSTVWGEFFATPVKSQVSVLHPEENGQGFNYLYAFVNQAAKNESVNGIAYNISVGLDSGASAIRATGRIYYKKYGAATKRDAGATNPGPDAPVSPPDAAASDGRRDAAVVPGPEAGSDARLDVPTSGAPDAGADARFDASAPDGASIDGPKDGSAIIDAAQVYTPNLILNPGAEEAVGSVDGTPVTTPGWTSTGGATAVQYGLSGYPALTDPGSPNRGLNLFTGGVADPISTLAQTIDLSAYASAIDTGQIGFALQGYLGGYQGQDDSVVVSVSFQTSATGIVLASASIGPVLAADRSGVSGMLAKSIGGTVPVGARTAVVTLLMTRSAGTANDGYADDLALVLLGVGGGADARVDASGI